jgi:hypothetical protein
MLYRVGRFLQLIGLILLPVAMAGNVSNELDLRQMLSVAGVGIVVFIVGWLLQQATRPK